MIDEAKAIRASLEARQHEALGLLAALVRTNSFTDNRAGVAAVGEQLAAELSAIEGISLVKLVPSERYAPHIVASTGAAKEEAAGSIVLVGHHDTVFPPGTFEGFSLENGVARGPGVLDMKGGLVVMLEALRALSSVDALARLSVRIIIVSDEEVGSPEGSFVLKREAAGASAALVFEAGRAKDAIITARKGTGNVHAVVMGRAAHAGNAHAEGANAIWALARFVDKAQGLTDYARGLTVNVGTINGGTSKNTVPDHAFADLDFRYVRRVDGEALLVALHEAATNAAVPGTSVILSGGIARPPLERDEKNTKIFEAYAVFAREAGLDAEEAPLVGGGSDAATTAALGIPSIDGLGPRGTGFHTREERIEVATLVPKAEALARFLRRYGARDSGASNEEHV